MIERNDRNNQPDRADEQKPPAAKPADEEVSSDELEDLEDVSGGANWNCGCGQV